MARLARVVVPGVAHLVTQRGNRGETVFFSEGGLRAVSRAAGGGGAEVWAYCLMPDHVHIITVPNDVDGLRRSFAECHRQYTVAINARQGWTGHLWQGRFGSVPMDDAHWLAAVRYASLNPVRAGLVARAEAWRWSRAAAQAVGQDDALVRAEPVLELVAGFWSGDEGGRLRVAIRRFGLVTRDQGAGGGRDIELRVGLRSSRCRARGVRRRNGLAVRTSTKGQRVSVLADR